MIKRLNEFSDSMNVVINDSGFLFDLTISQDNNLLVIEQATGKNPLTVKQVKNLLEQHDETVAISLDGFRFDVASIEETSGFVAIG